MKKREKVWTWR